MKNFLLAIFTIPHLAFSQTIVDSPVDESLIDIWISEEVTEYEGIYRFGMSEWESELYLSIDGNIISAQVKDHEWINSEDESLRGWQSRYRNYHNVRVINNKFYSDETEGEFITYEFEGRKINGLKLIKHLNSYDDKYEIGIFQTGDKLGYFNGDYTRTKFDIISDQVLNSFSVEELKIMRNEIFARYGYVFKKGGEMDEYFSDQRWYYPIDRDVNQLLTEIEKENIMKIRAIEARKKSP